MTLFLLPNVLGEVEHHNIWFPKSVDDAVISLEGLIAESEKEARHYLRRFISREQLDSVQLALLNEHTTPVEKEALLKPLLKGQKWGLISDCGLPCIADPGSYLVAKAHELGIDVQAFVGPSSIVLSLMLSGLSGQRFCFHGYISREPEERKKQLKIWEKRAKEYQETQIFIDAPYRNIHAFQSALETLEHSTKFCVAWNLTLPSQGVVMTSISNWKKRPVPPINKQPTLFLFA